MSLSKGQRDTPDENPPMATDPAYQRMVRERENERQNYLNAKTILTDLIAELRKHHYPSTPTQLSKGEPFALPVKVCRTCRPWPCATSVVLDRAEARLEEVTNE